MCPDGENSNPREQPLFCNRCQRTLVPGSGDFYVVTIEAIADPSPPLISAEDLDRDIEAEIRKLLAQIRDRSEQELIDDVYRRMQLLLCRRCYLNWIEDPVG